jgi:hypothetical protein
MTYATKALPKIRHTPGPWHATDQAVYGPDKQLIAKVAIGSDKDANCRLIAAAPELLAELMADERLLREYVEWHHRHQGACSIEWEDRLEATRDAISKAVETHSDRRQP